MTRGTEDTGNIGRQESQGRKERQVIEKRQERQGETGETKKTGETKELFLQYCRCFCMASQDVPLSIL